MDVRQMMAGLVQEGFNSSNMRPWKLHWDHQLYKSLEHQYQLGLEALNEHLPEIKVELTYRLEREGCVCTCIIKIVHLPLFLSLSSLLKSSGFSSCSSVLLLKRSELNTIAT